MITTLGGRDWLGTVTGRVEIKATGDHEMAIIIGQGGETILHMSRDQRIDAETETPPGGWREWTPRHMAVDPAELGGDWSFPDSPPRDKYASPGGATVRKVYPVPEDGKAYWRES